MCTAPEATQVASAASKSAGEKLRSGEWRAASSIGRARPEKRVVLEGQAIVRALRKGHVHWTEVILGGAKRSGSGGSTVWVAI